MVQEFRDRLVTPPEAAKILETHPQVVYMWAHAGYLEVLDRFTYHQRVFPYRFDRNYLIEWHLKYIGIPEMKRRFGVSNDMLKKWRKNAGLKSIVDDPGIRPFYSRDEVLKLLSSAQKL